MCKFVNVFSKLGFFVFAMATFTPAFSQLPEDIIDASVESAVEDAVSQAVESDVEETVETAVEQSVENAVEDSIAGAVEGAIENSVAGAVENAIESNVAGAVDETVSSAIEATVLDDVLAETADTATGVLSAGVQGGARAVRRDVEIVIADDGRRVIRHEWVLVVSAEDASEVAALGAPIVVRTPLEASGEILFVLSISDENPNAREIQDALAALGGDRFDRNSLFEMTAGSEARSSAPVSRRGGGAQNPPPGAQTIGLIDTAIESDHPALAGVGIEVKDFVSIGNKRPLDHGTAVASLIANAFPFGENIETPQVYAASVFFQTADGATGATTASLITAIDWLRREGVSVVNFSLAAGKTQHSKK